MLTLPEDQLAGPGPVHPFDLLGEPVRRRILELLATGERAAGELVAAVQSEFGISQAAGALST